MKPIPEAQIIDFETVEAIVHNRGKLNAQKCSAKVIKALKDRGVEVSQDQIEKNVISIVSGAKIPVLPSIFNGTIGPRHGKDKAYEDFWKLADKWLPMPERLYVGLPANQISEVYSRVLTLDSCERNTDMYKWQQKTVRMLKLDSLRIHLHHEDIFAFLINADQTWNIFDFDLMCVATPELADKVAHLVATKMYGTFALLNLTTSIGRNISKSEYKEFMPVGLQDTLIDYDLQVVETLSGYYRDRHVPQATEFIVVANLNK